jgi:hypothetical protein
MEDPATKSTISQLNFLIKDYDSFHENRSLVDKGNQEPGSGPFYLNILKMKIAGIPALDIRTTSPGGDDRTIYFKRSQFIYQFSNPRSYFSYNDRTRSMNMAEPKQVDSVFEDIISTFKFNN